MPNYIIDNSRIEFRWMGKIISIRPKKNSVKINTGKVRDRYIIGPVWQYIPWTL